MGKRKAGGTTSIGEGPATLDADAEEEEEEEDEEEEDNDNIDRSVTSPVVDEVENADDAVDGEDNA